MKSKEELNAIKNEVETENKKLSELPEEELEQISGGGGFKLRDERTYCCSNCNQTFTKYFPPAPTFCPRCGIVGPSYFQ